MILGDQPIMVQHGIAKMSSSSWLKIWTFYMLLTIGSIILTNSYAPTLTNDVWISVDTGSSMDTINASAGWTVRYCITALAPSG